MPQLHIIDHAPVRDDVVVVVIVVVEAHVQIL